METNSVINLKLVQLVEKGVRALNILGVVLIITAVAMPFIVKNYYDSRIKGYESLANLGPIGDFIGGTTVAFLTAASVVLLLATIIMQRKEIKISQQSIEELVKQTEATVRQAEEARKETQLTNATMKKQQFETTFFNMINLHHRILGEIKIGDSIGREAIKSFYTNIKLNYDIKIFKKYSNDLKKEALIGNTDVLDNLIKSIYIDYQLSRYESEFDEHFVPITLPDGTDDFSEYNDFYQSLEQGTNTYWNKEKKEHEEYFESNIKGIIIEYKKILLSESTNFRLLIERNISNEYINKFSENFINNPLKELKQEAYEMSYKEKENQVGHYYRNLYRIVKLIQGENFGIDKEYNELEKSKYRGILRAQLSSYELLMIFYNVAYSEKGKKFKEILKDTNFFDDHLIAEDFIWANDYEELVKSNIQNEQNITNT